MSLLDALADRLATPPAVLLERDGDYPPAAALHAELATLRPRTALPTPASRPFRAHESPDPRPRATAPGRDLATRQGVLVDALVAGAPSPPGFDGARVTATRRALLRKRAGEAAKAWPLLAAALGDAWSSTFAGHHDGHEPAGALRDGWDLARSLHERGELSAAAAVELAERESSMRYDGRGAPRLRRRTRLHRLLRR